MITIDHSMSWIIWPLLILGFMALRRGRYRGPRGPWDMAGMSGWGSRQQGVDPEALLKELESQRAQLDEMAARLAELENRADFTERLLAAPHEDALKSTSPRA
jgi:hypothetical protein